MTAPRQLDNLEPSHRQRLLWFHERAGQVTGWPDRLRDGSYLVTRPKGIFKPRDLLYALSVRVQLDSPYADGVVRHRADGTWHLPYHQENPDPSQRDREYTNTALMRCMEDDVPVGVLVQRRTRPVKPVFYDVLGLAVPVLWEDGYFYLEGFGANGPHTPDSADRSAMREVIRTAAREAQAGAAGQELPAEGESRVAPPHYPGTVDRGDALTRSDLARPRGKAEGGDMNETVNIRPGVAMLGLFPHMKYQPWYALGELVDNGLQSYIANRDRLHDLDPDFRLRIEIEVDKNQGGGITVRDNAAGIAHSDWHRAFLVAEPPADASGLSQFGVGMKAACCWFSKNWSLRTTALGEEVVRKVSFDVPEIVATRDDTLAVFEEPTDWRTHFTEIRMTNLYRPPHARTQGKIKEYLGGIYRQFLRNGDVEITYNGAPIEFEEHPVLVAPPWNDQSAEPVEWRKDVDIRLDSGRRVRGFVAIREKGATKSAGLALFYRNKVVTGAGEDTYRPEEIFGRSNDFRSQRVFGELHMDDFNVTYTKDALVWYDEEEEFIEKLAAELDAKPYQLLRQAREYRARKPAQVPPDFARKLLDDTAIVLEQLDTDTFTAHPATQDEHDQQPGPSLPSTSVSPELFGDRSLELTILGETWHVVLRLVSDEANSNWLTVLPDQEGDTTRLTLTVNQSHPFMRAFCELPGQELEPVWRVAIALGLAQELARRGGARQTALVTMRVNDLLRNYLSKKAV